VGHPFRQRVQSQIDISNCQDGANQKYAHDDHQPVRLAWLGEIEWQMVRRQRMQFCVQLIPSDLTTSVPQRALEATKRHLERPPY
jgi:hypothetical protein